MSNRYLANLSVGTSHHEYHGPTRRLVIALLRQLGAAGVTLRSRCGPNRWGQCTHKRPVAGRGVLRHPIPEAIVEAALRVARYLDIVTPSLTITLFHSEQLPLSPIALAIKTV